jgi:transposase-like protein
MARHRSFRFEFKRQVVLDFLEGRAELRGLVREHNLSQHLIGCGSRSTRQVNSTMKWRTPAASRSMRPRSPSSSAKSAS